MNTDFVSYTLSHTHPDLSNFLSYMDCRIRNLKTRIKTRFRTPLANTYTVDEAGHLRAMTQQKITDIEVPADHIIDRMLVIYTPDEDKEDTNQCIEYAKDHVGYELSSWESTLDYDDTGSVSHSSGDAVTSTSDPEQLIENAQVQDVEDVIVTSLDAVTSPVRDLATLVREVTDEGVTIHTVQGLTITAGSETHRVLEACSMIEAENNSPEIVPTETGAWSGRPPLGHKVENGRLKRGYDYERVRATVQAVDEGEVTKTDAADKLGTSRATINRCLQDRRKMYKLD